MLSDEKPLVISKPLNINVCYLNR